MLDYAFGRAKVNGTDDAVKCLFYGFTVLGMNPPEKNRISYFLRSFSFLFLAFIIGPLSFNMIYFKDNDMSMNALLISISGDINVIGVPVKLVAVGLSIHYLQSAVPFMKELDKRCTSEIEWQMIRDVVKAGNRMILQFFSLGVLYSSSTVAAGMILGRSGYGLYFHFIDYRNSRWELYLQNILEFILVSGLISYQAVNDGYPSVYILIIRAHLRILKRRVSLLGKDPERTLSENYEELVRCVADHHCLLKLLECVRPVVSISLAIQLLVTATTMGITLVHIVVFADSSTMFTCFVYLAAIIVQISVTCYQASQMLSESEELPLALFECNWLGQDRRFQKMLIFFIQHTQIPMTLMALKTINISLVTNIQIFKFSFSLYTFLRNMNFRGKV